ncbi:MAG: transposase [Chloroflexi bacterium]|nr:transposase [Chloroflexota bacterium]MYE41805.1 transposase [Chloroflexota bacterium]
MAPTNEQNQYSYNDDQEHFEALLRDICDRVAPPDCESGLPELSASDVAHCVNVHNQASRIAHYLDNPALTPLLKALVEESARPLAAMETYFAVDGTVFGWNGAALRPWGVQCHLACGVKTGVIVAVEVGGASDNSSRFLPGLLRTVKNSYPGAEAMSAGKAYLSRENFEVAGKLDMALYIPFKKNSVSSRPGWQESPAWNEALYLYRHDHEEFMRRYRPHSVVEDVMDTIEAGAGVCSHTGTGTTQLNRTLIEAAARNVRIVSELMCGAVA